MAVIVKLFHGADSLSLNTGRYKVGQNFAPPTASRSVTFGRAIVGSDAVSKRRENVQWGFSVHISTSSVQEGEKALRDLQSFLNRAGDKKKPLYVAYRSDDSNGDFEPYFGQLGAYKRFEVVHGQATANNYGVLFTSNGDLPNVAVGLNIKPQSAGLQQRAAQTKGGIIEEYIGEISGISRGTIVPPAATNKFTNPAFMNSTYSTGWTATGSGFITSKNTDPEFVLFGDTSARVAQVTLSASQRLTQSINVGNTNAHRLSFYVKADDGGAVTTGEVKIWYGGTVTPDAAISVGNGWYRIVGTVTGVNSATASGITVLSNSRAFYVDGFQLEESAIITPFVYGDMLGCTWSGTKNASTSTRTVSFLRYKWDDVLGLRTGYTIRFIWIPDEDESASNRYLLEDDNNDIGIAVDSSEKYNFAVASGQNTQTAAVGIAAGVPEILHFTYDGATAIIYRNGASAAEGSGKTAATSAPTLLYVGSDNTPANHLGCTILGFATYRRVMTAAQVLSDYNQVAQQVTDKERIDPLPWLWTKSGNDTIANDNNGTLENFAVVGGLMGDDLDIEYIGQTSHFHSLANGITWGSLPVDPRVFDKDILTSGGTNTLLFIDGAGSADTDANNDVRDEITIPADDSLNTLISSSVSIPVKRILRSVDHIYGAVILKEGASGNGLRLRLTIINGSGADKTSTNWRTAAVGGSGYRMHVVGPLSIDFDKEPLDANRSISFLIEGTRPTGSTAGDVYVSHGIFFPNYSSARLSAFGVASSTKVVFVNGRSLGVGATGAPTTILNNGQMNNPLVLKSGVLNVLPFQVTSDNFQASATQWNSDYTLDVDKFGITPRNDIY